jgi:hypothetical protein
MKHSSTRDLFDYWNRQRGLRRAPERGEIEPGAIRHALADTFILAIDAEHGHPFRIAGTRVCAAFGRELRGAAFLDLWATASRDFVREILDIVAGETLGAVVGASAPAGEGSVLKLELLLLPLTHRGGSNTRVLGALVPTETPYWLGVSALGQLTPAAVRYLGGDAEPALTGSESAGRRLRRGLVVYDGGHV